jgi:hypothetical protein
MQKFIFFLLLYFALNNWNIYSQQALRPDDMPEFIDTVSTFDTRNIGTTIAAPVASIPVEVDERCSAFFKSLMTETTIKAYMDLLKGSPLSQNEDKIKNQVDKTLEAVKAYGKITGYEQAGAEYISLSYLKVSYLSLHPFNPLLWTFTFYNSPTIGWIVLNLKLTDTF